MRQVRYHWNQVQKLTSDSNVKQLYQLARLYGVQASYYDVYHRRRRRSPTESLLSILRSLGAPLNTLQDAHLALRQKQQAIWQSRLEPVLVCWGGRPPIVEIRLPANARIATLAYHLQLDTGDTGNGRWLISDSPVSRIADVVGITYLARSFILPGRLPLGYHHLTVDFPGGAEESLIISAPLKAYAGPSEKIWGVFLPLYALRTQNNWGSGDYSDFARLTDWVSNIGGNVIATLPLLPTLPDENADFSPYRPSSRLLWNEFYLDINRIPELADCPEAQRLISSNGFQNEVDALRNLPSVDYKRNMASKRRVLEELCRHLYSQESSRLRELRRFSETHPVLQEYARFNAVREKHSGSGKDDYDEEVRRYYLYAQWLAHQQMAAVSETAQKKSLQLYLDLPLGVRPDGYDVWRYRDAFMSSIQVGAPPDTVFTGGQNWQFPPLHPQKIRKQKYEYFIAYLRHHLESAGILRIDHVMGFHRLFCIPEGMEASQGVYLRYPAEEFYAILTLESQRTKTMIIGEDLGNVPRSVRPAMKRHNLNRMYVLRYELADDIKNGIRPIPANAVASLNTHDMPPFTSFWQGLDIGERVKLGVLDEKHAETERADLPNVRRVLMNALRQAGWLTESDDSIQSILRACLSYLASSPANVVLVNLEDLWLETNPQNVPGTINEHPNWRNKLKLTFEEFCQMSQVIDILKSVAELRRQADLHKNI